MKKLLVWFMLMLTCVPVVMAGELAIGLREGYWMPAGGGNKYNAHDNNIVGGSFDNQFGEGGLSVRYSNAFGVDNLWVRMEYDRTTTGNEFKGGSLKLLIPYEGVYLRQDILGVTVAYDFSEVWGFTPYIGGGVGKVWHGNTSVELYPYQYDTTKVTVHDTEEAHIVAGVRFDITEKFCAGLEAKRLWSRAPVTVNGTYDHTEDTGGLGIIGILEYKF